MPLLTRIQNKDDGSIYTGISSYKDVIEREEPAKWFFCLLCFRLCELEGFPKTVAKEVAKDRLRKLLRKSCPSFLLSLFDSRKKREQEYLLRGQSVTPENLICWLLQAGVREGTYSQYGYEGGAGDLSGRTPVLIDASDPDNIKAIGKTDLSQEALMHLVETQHKVLAQIVDFEDGRWYCFYRTHRGLAGREPGKHGQHLHFISSAYGVDRGNLVENFKKGICPSNGFHVKLVGYYDEKGEAELG